jgi:hypothetical protein
MISLAAFSCKMQKQYNAGEYNYIHHNHHTFKADSISYDDNCVRFYDLDYSRYVKICGEYVLEEKKQKN